MAETVVAWFDDVARARAAVLDLLNHNFIHSDIDVIASEDALAIAAANGLDVHENGILVAVRAMGDSGPRAIALLRQHQPLDVRHHPFNWGEQGLEGFELIPSPIEVEVLDEARRRYEHVGEGEPGEEEGSR